MKVALYDNHITLESFRYFVVQASSVSLGCYGQKKNSLLPGTPPYLDVFDVLAASKLEAITWMTTPPLEVEFADTKGINLLAGLKIPGLAKGQVGVKASDITENRVRLLKISPVGEAGLIKQLNDSPKVLEKLIAYGGKARVVESVIFAVEGESYQRFAASGKNDGAVIVDGLLVKAEREANWDKTSAMQFHDMVIGYSLAEPQWNAFWDKNKTEVVELRDDQQGW
jgi:hypothetical protein